MVKNSNILLKLKSYVSKTILFFHKIFNDLIFKI